MGNDLALIRSAKTILLTTCKRDGRRFPRRSASPSPGTRRSSAPTTRRGRPSGYGIPPRAEAAAPTLRGKPVGRL